MLLCAAPDARDVPYVFECYFKKLFRVDCQDIVKSLFYFLS